MIAWRVGTKLTLLFVLLVVCLAGQPAVSFSISHASSITDKTAAIQLDTSTSATGFPVFGFETYTNYINNNTIKERAQDVGASWVRLNTVSWRDLQPTEDTPPDQWNWNTLATFEKELSTANELGLTPLVIADDFPDWAVTPYYNPYSGQDEVVPCAALKTEYFDDYALFLSEVVSRYHQDPYNVNYWELGNEIDVAPSLMSRELQDLFGCWGVIEDEFYGGEHYGEMLKVATPSIKAVDPDAQVVIGGLLLDRANTEIAGRGKPEKFLQGILEAGAGNSFDIVAFHSYPWFSWENGRQEDVDLTDYRWSAWGGMTIGKVKYLRSIMTQYQVDKPLFLDEAALLYWGGGDPTNDFLQTQADHIVRVHLRGLSVGVQMFSWYTLHDSGWNSSGLLNSDRSVRPAYTAYQYLISQLRDTTSITTTSDYGSAVEAYRFTKGSQVLDVLWSKDATSDQVAIPKVAFSDAMTRDGESIDPSSSSTRVLLSVGIEPVYIVRTPQNPATAPSISAVEPTGADNTTSRQIIIHGENFQTGATIWLENPSVQEIQSYQLNNGVSIENRRIEVTVPAMLPPGSYDVIVANPDGLIATKADGYTITAYAPKISDVRPRQSRADLPGIIHIYGENFRADTTVRLEPSLTLSDTLFINDTHIRAVLPANATAPGTYAVSVVNLDTTSGTMQDGMLIYANDGVDVYGYVHHLWTDPIQPRSTMPIHIGMELYSQGSISQDVTVNFYRGEAENETNRIGRSTVAVTHSQGTTTVPSQTPLVWQEEESGIYTLCATLDATNTTEEVSEINNKYCRSVRLLEPGLDNEPPVINQVTINGTNPTTTTNSIVTLAFSTTDTVSTGLALSTSVITAFLVQEYEYNPGNAAWIPVQWTTWETDTQAILDGSYTWNLVPSSGKKYIQVWAVDSSGNISQPATAWVVYSTPDQAASIDLPSAKLSPKTMPPLALPEYLLPTGSIYSLYLPIVERPTE